MDSMLCRRGARAPTWEKVVREGPHRHDAARQRAAADRATLDGFAAAVEATIDRAAATAPNPARWCSTG
jgi:hypothetical protein